jgi:hypothetical protein
MCKAAVRHCAVRMSKLYLAEMVCFFMPVNATMHMVSACMYNVSVRISYMCTRIHARVCAGLE